MNRIYGFGPARVIGRWHHSPPMDWDEVRIGPTPWPDTAHASGELAKVAATAKAKDSAATVTTVQKDPKDSYEVDGTQASALEHSHIGADLKTITISTSGFRGKTAGPARPARPARPSAVRRE